ncbi:MAG: hypothetical protein KBA26_09950 [Candidatus Delongbacteria bacterium]|nr:hypothetical protein [Candidatus Delongbacteria bacterium]
MNQPQISVIVMCGKRQGMLDRFLRSFISTQPLDKVEMIFFLPQDFNPDIPESQFSFPIQRITYSGIDYFPMLARAVESASSDTILFQENHTDLRVNVIDPLLEIIQSGNYDSVGCVIHPGSKNSITDWTAYFSHYLGWGPGHPVGPTTGILPGHNSAWKKSVLMGLGDQLPLYLQAETILYWKLAKQGHQFYFTDRFYLIHDDKMGFGEMLAESFWFGWIFADTRQKVEGWSRIKRWIYAVAVYAKPLIRLWQVCRSIPHRQSMSPFLAVMLLPTIGLNYFANAAGESIGILRRPDPAIRHYSREH